MTLNWEALIETLIKDNELSKRLKAMIIEGSEALANDPMVRDIVSAFGILDSMIMSNPICRCSLCYCSSRTAS